MPCDVYIYCSNAFKIINLRWNTVCVNYLIEMEWEAIAEHSSFHLLCEETCTANNCAFVQLVYKVKLDFVLEQLASASVGGYGQDVWSELVEEAKTNLMKITVSVAMLWL